MNEEKDRTASGAAEIACELADSEIAAASGGAGSNDVSWNTQGNDPFASMVGELEQQRPQQYFGPSEVSSCDKKMKQASLDGLMRNQ